MDEPGNPPEEPKATPDPTDGPKETPKPGFWAALLRSAVPGKPTEKVVPTADEEKAKDAQHTRRMRRWVAGVVVVTFWAELIGMFFLLLWQGRGGHFHLNDWLIGTVANGVVIQTILVLLVIATDLFYRGKGKMPGGKSE